MGTKQALLLLNMGGPNNVEEVELFLRNMFADENILTMDRYTRKFVATIIINKRLEEVKENYALLGGKSPLPELTDTLIIKLKTKLDMPIYPAMRYVPPFADVSLEKCQKEGIEELILFPYINRISDASQQHTSLVAAPFGSVENPIGMMKHEHTDEGDYFRKIASLTNTYTPPADACNTYKVTFELLRQLEEDLHTHIHLENNILFIKAIKEEKELRLVGGEL